jgi:hypothetical protein
VTPCSRPSQGFLDYYLTMQENHVFLQPNGAGQVLKYVAMGQGLYFAFTGLWGLLDIFTFQLVTGPKVDLWLVKTVSVLVTVIGSTLFLGGLRQRLTFELMVLAAGSALGLAGIDVLYVTLGRISSIYLLDAAAEAAFAAAWTFFGWRARAALLGPTLSPSSGVSSSLAERPDVRFTTRRATRHP